MKRGAALVGMIALTLGLAGCVADPSVPAIFERERAATDDAPPAALQGIDPASTRFVGADSAGNDYWVGRGEDGRNFCIISYRADEQWSGTCGDLNVGLGAASGAKVEFATSPVDLVPENAELIGDTLLVTLP